MRTSDATRAWFVAPDAIRLYGLADMARMLGVRSSAMTNYARRYSGPSIPAAGYCTSRGAPLWTAEQVRTMAADRAAAILAAAETAIAPNPSSGGSPA